jgi:hypothetical protein
MLNIGASANWVSAGIPRNGTLAEIGEQHPCRSRNRNVVHIVVFWHKLRDWLAVLRDHNALPLGLGFIHHSEAMYTPSKILSPI